MHNQYRDAGFHVFGLHGVTKGVCNCGNENCEAFYKHPLTSAWQHTALWDDSQWEMMHLMDAFKTGFGVLCRGHLIIDIDPRNGGNEGYDQLVTDTGIDFKDDSEFVVATGGGGWHIYYKHNSNEKLHSSLKAYKGVDFKSSGFVVGAGSMHESGSPYEVQEGFVDDITELPAVLKEILTKREIIRDSFSANNKEVTANEVIELLSFVSCYDDYYDWVEIGMIIHESLGSDGYDIFDNWSKNSDKYDASQIDLKWHSFGKSSSKVTVGTLIQKAKANGYIPSVTFNDDTIIPEVVTNKNIDLTKASGLVGEFIEYINGCSRFPRKNLAVSAALMAVGNIGGMRFEDEAYGVTPNLFCFNVAGSATGKEAIQQAQNELMFVAGMGTIGYGAIKSEQEIYRNILRNQAACYTIDEFGITLNKIEQASKGGAAGYMAGVVGALMSIYSKANGKMQLGADLAETLIMEISKQIAVITKKIDNNEAKDYHHQKLESLMLLVIELKNGHIANPFLSLSGYTTQSTFNDLMTYQQATSGFIGRALIFEEKENNPRRKPLFKMPFITDKLKAKILTLRNGGTYEVSNNIRVEFKGKKTVIKTESKALVLLDEIYEEFHQKAEHAMNNNGLEAIARRSLELVLKVSLVLAIGDKQIRTLEHVQWAYSLVSKDLDNKISLTSANRAEEEQDLSTEVLNKVLQKLDKDSGISLGGLANKMRKIDKENIEKALDHLISNGKAILKEITPKRGPNRIDYFLL